MARAGSTTCSCSCSIGARLPGDHVRAGGDHGGRAEPAHRRPGVVVTTIPAYARIVRTQTRPPRRVHPGRALTRRRRAARAARAHPAERDRGCLILASMEVPVVITIEAGLPSSASACARRRRPGQHPERRLCLHPQHALAGDRGRHSLVLSTLGHLPRRDAARRGRSQRRHGRATATSSIGLSVDLPRRARACCAPRR